MFNRISKNLTAIALTLVLSISATMTLLMPSQAQTVTPDIEASTKTVIADQLAAFQSKDYDRAFSHAAPTIKKIFKTSDNFIGMVKGGYSQLYNPDSYIFGRNFNMDGTVHQEVITTDQQGKQWQAIYTLREQPDGSWKITGVKMQPYSGAAT